MDAVRDIRNGEESKSLELLLQSKVEKFFEEVWQKSCALFRLPQHNDNDKNSDRSAALSSTPSIKFDTKDAEQKNPLQYLVSSGVSVTQKLLEQLDHNRNTDGTTTNGHHDEPPLIFQNQSILSPEDFQQRYDQSVWAALLDGSSIVINHADLRSPWIAAVCQDLQRSIPHAYANVYITPAHQQAVQAHADDRDVFIIQLCGSKQWTVFTNVPIPLPYSNEQVGKDGLEVPQSVLQGPKLIETILKPGDVLYLPRGYVHCATSGANVSSHVTVAMATHDWTLAGLLEKTGSHVWRNQLELRLALPRSVGRRSLTNEQRQTLRTQMDQAIESLRNELSVEAIETAMAQKYERHNDRADLERTALMSSPSVPDGSTIRPCCGPEAAHYVSLATRLRPASEQEKVKVQSLAGTARTQIGLHVQDEIYEDAMRLVATLKGGCHLPLQDIDTKLCCVTVLAVAKRCVSLGALAIDSDTSSA